MNLSELKEKENNLFENWKRKRPTLILDGIVDYENYFGSMSFTMGKVIKLSNQK